jgi:hypothetical protein
VSGAFCGRLFDELGPAPESIEFWLMDKKGTTIAKASVDAKSRFQFPPIPRGDYRVGLVGFTTSYDFVRVTGSTQTACDRQLYVTLIVSSECSGTTTISERQPKAIRKPTR